MRAEDLDHQELLELNPMEGTIHIAGQSAVLLDIVALGTLRQYLIENLGQTVARAILTKLGFAHGWRMAQALKREFRWDSDEAWREACTRIHELGGFFHGISLDKDPLSGQGLRVASSFEADQHILHFGRTEFPVCWMIDGVLSGYLSYAKGEEVYVLEERCIAKGDAQCSHYGRTRAEWGEEKAHELAFFEATRLKECLDIALHQLTASLKAIESKLRERRRILVRVTENTVEPNGIVAKSPAMRKLVDLARRVAKVDSTVLITGESGAGKERIARLVHEESSRATGPFIAINCGAIAETLLESELFGHARGSFTGANLDRPGLFEAAHRGTLLLDEVGEVSPAMQVKLLRALQEREIRRVGENKTRQVDVRVIAATNRDLAQGVAGGEFRQDLYYRLKVVELHLPPLRERREDILPLARVLLNDAMHRMKRSLDGLSPAVVDQILRYDWPGNVRELENAMERAVALAQGRHVELEDLPEEISHKTICSAPVRGQIRTLEAVEKEYILAVLELNQGNQTRCAEQLKIGSATLYRKLKKYGLIDDRIPAHKAPRGPTAAP